MLIDATVESIFRHGIAETSISTITEIAGLSRGMVRHYFASKDAMMVAAYESLLAKWKENFYRAREGEPLERILRVIETMYRPPNFHPRDLSVWISLNAGALHDPKLAAMCSKETATWLDVFKEEIAAYGEQVGRSYDTDRIAETLLAVSDGLWIKHMIEPNRIGQQKALEINTKLVFDLLGIADASQLDKGR